MNATIKPIAIETLAEKLQGKLWEKGDLKRIYIDAGYNTKKMSTKTYIYEKNGRFIVNCTVNCPSQDPNWEKSQEQEIAERYNERISEIIGEFGFETENPEIAIIAALSEEKQVKGYFIRWHEERVAINRFGKLGYRKRQKIHTYSGPESRVPTGFIELSDDDFNVAMEKEKSGATYGFGDEPNLIGAAQRIANLKAEIENIRQREESQKAAEEAKSNEELQQKIRQLKENGITDALQLWKAAGCYHPAPTEVMEAKTASGLNWKQFQKSIV